MLQASRGPPVHAAVRVDVTRGENGRWRAVLAVEARGARGVRDIDAESCEAIASAAELIIAVAAEGGAPALASPSHTGPTAPEGAVQAPPSRPAILGSRALVAVAAVADGALLPSLAPGVEASVGWLYGWPSWRIRLLASAAYLPSQTASTASLPGEGGSFTAFGAAGRVCYSLARGAFELGPCLGAEADWMSADGFGPATFNPRKQSAFWWSGLGTGFVSVEAARGFAVFARGDAVLPVLPKEFVINPGAVEVHKASPGVRGAVGVEARFF